MAKYFVTVGKNGDQIVDRKPFDDYGEAVASLNLYYQPKAGRCVLKLSTEVVNGVFARSFGGLNIPEDIEATDESTQRKYSAAAKQSNAFDYDASYFFLIESEFGISERENEDDE